MPIRLHVNVDHVATVRNARGAAYPDPVHLALLCEDAGADGITIHLREDRRHIVDRDLERMRESIGTLLNLECAATDEMVAIALRVKPDVVTFVPERREERTTEGGLDVVAQRDALAAQTAKLRAGGIRVSFFIAADEAQIEASRVAHAQQIELHTGPYAHAHVTAARAVQLSALAHAAHSARALGLDVAAGHGLTRHNVLELAAIPEVEELNIGHAIVADALAMGMAGAVRAMREAIVRGVARRS
jgi:pyridoxine 5-phosphate synthase